MPKLSVLHLSDIHIGNTLPNETVVDIAIRVVDDIANNLRNEIDCVVVTGDIFEGIPSSEGKPSHDVEEAILFFETLLGRLNKKIASNLKREDFVFVPGNHDLKREDNKANFDEYKKFLKAFQSEEYFAKNYNDTHLYTIKIFEEQKVVIIGFNSCMLERCHAHDIECINDIEWNDGTFEKQVQEAIKTKIIEHYQSKWDDYGKISPLQLSEAFDELDSKSLNLRDYTMVACFHHHFYPFPENYNQIGDRSLMRNFDDVIKKLVRYNVRIVLHGHKHLPIIRPITSKEYLSNPNSVIYVFSAGSFAKKGKEQFFQVIDIYSPKENKIAKVKIFDYKGKELSVDNRSIPPEKNYEKNATIEILEAFSSEYPEEYRKYQYGIKDKDNISAKFRIDEIIKSIGKIITPFETIKKDLLESKEKNLILLLSIQYRINILNKIRNNSKEGEYILEDLKKCFRHIDASKIYKQKLFDLLEANDHSRFEKCYSLIENDSTYRERTVTAYAVIAIFFTDLYLTLSDYGKFYYDHEGINANIKFPENDFHRNIPTSTIEIYSEVDRRSSFIKFRCSDPTVHKVAVLIIKDFEKKLNELEDSFKVLNLKIYYLIPEIEKNKYELENFNFEAYIPTLLPLLTGDNLYVQKEVFIRELIQNSLDAILFREKLDSRPFDKTIKIEIGHEKTPDNETNKKYLRITDEGIGMDTFKIERYFTSIGRSFYVSEEYSELKKNKGIKHDPISNFGIGFLSAFMVCKEISVTTKSYKNTNDALEIYIPNYDGCFFINKKEGSGTKIGTSITLYEDERCRLDFDEIKKYLTETILDLQLNIEIIENETKNIEEILPYNLRRGKQISLFIPMDEDGLKRISWGKEVKTGEFINKYNYGLLVDFDPNRNTNQNIYLNSGIKLSQPSINLLPSYNCDQYYNFPASYVQLDVAREKINKLKNDCYSNEKMISLLAEQANELIKYLKKEKNELPLFTCDNIYLYLTLNNINVSEPQLKNKFVRIKENLYHLNIKKWYPLQIEWKALTFNSMSFFP